MIGASLRDRAAAATQPSPHAVLSKADIPSAARLFVCGDIHGCYDHLMSRLSTLGFDKAKDRLFALGDLVDRGPRSADVFELLNEDWFYSIRGNHEELMIEAARGNADMHIINGGGWFAQLDDELRMEYAEVAKALPIAMTVELRDGRRIGLVHADMPGTDWNEFVARLETPQVQDYAMWTRERVHAAKRNQNLSPITGVDHVYFGHTPLSDPVHAANMSWLDTGCFATGRLTVVEIVA